MALRITPVDITDSIQISVGTETNYKNLLELKIGDKTTLLSTGSTPESQQLANELYHVLYFMLKGCHPKLPPPPSIAWSLPLITSFTNGQVLKDLFVKEAVYQGIQEEIRPWVSTILLSSHAFYDLQCENIIRFNCNLLLWTPYYFTSHG